LTRNTRGWFLISSGEIGADIAWSRAFGRGSFARLFRPALAVPPLFARLDRLFFKFVRRGVDCGKQISVRTHSNQLVAMKVDGDFGVVQMAFGR
jgi:hypothetical protein